MSEELGRRAEQMLDALGRCSEEPDLLSRPFLSSSHRAAADLVLEWMRDAGADAFLNPVGTVVGRLRLPGAGPRKTLLIGSHIDTVPDAGRYDGMLGVVVGILAMQEVQRRAIPLPFDIELLAFGDEEGLRFPDASLGSRSLTEVIPPQTLDVRDAGGVSVREALTAFGLPGDPGLDELRYDADDLLGYLEVHVEQGPVLEARDEPLGVVTSIAAAHRFRITVEGTGGHAGTVPASLRRDALIAASAMVLAIDEAAAAVGEDVRATVGELVVDNPAANAIPGRVRFSLDLRAPRDETLAEARRAVLSSVRGVAESRGVGLDVVIEYEGRAAVCDPHLSEVLERAVRTLGLSVPRLPSGAGHDAQTIGNLTPIAMLFVRCRGGVSHHPDEYAAPRDIGLAVAALVNALTFLEPALPG